MLWKRAGKGGGPEYRNEEQGAVVNKVPGDLEVLGRFQGKVFPSKEQQMQRP